MSDVEIRVLYQDDALLVCRKPTGVSSEEGGMGRLLAGQGLGTCYCVHRLDRAVGGVMVYARTAPAAAALSAAIAARAMDKGYLAVVQGRPAEDAAVLRDLLYHDAAKNKSYVVSRPRRGVREAELRYTLLACRSAEELSLLRVRLHTGRSHQIRVQLASRGLPLAGDRRYGSRLAGELALWSESLRFPHPLDGRELRFSAPPPAQWPWTLFGLHNN